MERQTLQNEIAVIGSLLLAQDCLGEIERSGLLPSDFIDSRCSAIYSAALNCRDNGRPYEAVYLASEVLSRTGEDVSEWVRGAMDIAPSASNLSAYCELVKRESQRRRLREAIDEASVGLSAGDWTDGIERLLGEIQSIRTGYDSDVTTGAEWVKKFQNYYRETKGNPGNAYCKTGYDELDAQLGGGMFRSEVYVIGARPGMGKTTLGINIAESVASRGDAVLFVSLEMTDVQIMAKRIALEGGLKYTGIMSGRLEEEDEEKMGEAIKRVTNRPFFLTTRSGMTVGEISKVARQIKNLSVIIVDYLGLIPPAAESQSKPRYEQMTEISAGIKALAKSLNVPILALAQLNRENMTRKDKRPTMSDLRDSGAVEQDAGAIILLHRTEYYETREQGDEAETEDIELNVAKNRHAAPGMIHMTWDGARGTIKSKVEMPLERKQSVNSYEDLPF